MVQQNSIYISYTPHKREEIIKVRKLLGKIPFTNVTSSWIDIDEDSYIFKNEKHKICRMNTHDIKNSGIFIAFVGDEPTSDQMLEIGNAMGRDIPVFIHTNGDLKSCSIFMHYHKIFIHKGGTFQNFMDKVRSSDYWSRSDSIFTEENLDEWEAMERSDMRELENLIRTRNSQ